MKRFCADEVAKLTRGLRDCLCCIKINLRNLILVEETEFLFGEIQIRFESRLGTGLIKAVASIFASIPSSRDLFRSRFISFVAITIACLSFI